jgi:hypothetical protein
LPETATGKRLDNVAEVQTILFLKKFERLWIPKAFLFGNELMIKDLVDTFIQFIRN